MTNKFRAKGQWLGGQYFASQKELKRFHELSLLQRAGEIAELTCQPRYYLEIEGKPILIRSEGYPKGRRASFRPDFRYTNKAGEIIIEDTKSSATRTEAYALRKAVFEAITGLTVIES